MVSVLGWVTIQGLDVDAVTTNTRKSQKRRNGAFIILYVCFWAKKKKFELSHVICAFPIKLL